MCVCFLFLGVEEVGGAQSPPRVINVTIYIVAELADQVNFPDSIYGDGRSTPPAQIAERFLIRKRTH